MNQNTNLNDGIGGCYPSLNFVPDLTLILGKRGSGKTFFVINDIFTRISDEIDDVFIISNSSIPHSEYLQITDRIYSIEHLDKIHRYVTDPNRKLKNKLLIVDVSNKDIYFNNRLIDLSSCCHHINLKMILVNSSSVGIPPHLRYNIKWILFGNESCTSEIKRNFDLFGSKFGNYDNFENHYDIIKGWEFMVLDHGSISEKVNLKIVKSGKQLKLKCIQSPQIDTTIDKSNETKEIIEEVNILIDQLVKIRNRLKKLDSKI